MLIALVLQCLHCPSQNYIFASFKLVEVDADRVINIYILHTSILYYGTNSHVVMHVSADRLCGKNMIMPSVAISKIHAFIQ